MNLKTFAATLRATALSAPEIADKSAPKAAFKHGAMTFRCLNSVQHITALANRLEKDSGKNYARSKMPTPPNIKRESIKVLINRFLKDGDTYNAQQLAGEY